MTENLEINHFHAYLGKEAPKTFRNKSAPKWKILDEELIVFQWRYFKPETQTTAKHEWHKLTFDLNAMYLSEFLEELINCAGKAFGDNTQIMINSLLYA